jgi:hypothetical protein
MSAAVFAIEFPFNVARLDFMMARRAQRPVENKVIHFSNLTDMRLHRHKSKPI